MMQQIAQSVIYVCSRNGLPETSKHGKYGFLSNWIYVSVLNICSIFTLLVSITWCHKNVKISTTVPHSRSWSNVHVRGERGLFANHPIWWKKMFCRLNGQTGLTPVPVWSRWSCRLFYATTKCDLLCQHALNAWQRWLFDKRNRNLARSVNTTLTIICFCVKVSGAVVKGTMEPSSRIPEIRHWWNQQSSTKRSTGAGLEAYSTLVKTGQ